MRRLQKGTRSWNTSGRSPNWESWVKGREEHSRQRNTIGKDGTTWRGLSCWVKEKKRKEKFCISYSDSSVTKRTIWFCSTFTLLCFNTQYLTEFLWHSMKWNISIYMRGNWDSESRSVLFKVTEQVSGYAGIWILICLTLKSPSPPSTACVAFVTGNSRRRGFSFCWIGQVSKCLWTHTGLSQFGMQTKRNGWVSQVSCLS